MKLLSKLTCLGGHQYDEGWQSFVKVTRAGLSTAKRTCCNCGQVDYKLESMEKLIEQGEQIVAERALAALRAATILTESLPTQTQKISI